MIRKKDGFLGERSVVLPPMIVEMEEKDPLVSSLFITDIGHYPMAEHHHRIRTVGINQFVLIYCVDGSGFYKLRGRKYEVRKNHYFILPAGEPHEYGADEGKKWTIYWVHFRGKHASIYAEGADKPQEVKVAINSNISNRNNIFEEMLSTLHFGKDVEDLRYASSLLHYYLASLRYLRQYRSTDRYVTGKTTRRKEETDWSSDMVQGAIHFMKENVEQKISLADILNYVGYSSSRFSAIFKKRTGLSPLSYFNKLKIEYACSLLSTTDMHVNQICYKVGISDSLYFSRLFSKVMGMSPTQYRMNKEQRIDAPQI